MLKALFVAIPLLLNAGTYSFNSQNNIPAELIKKATAGDSEAQYIAGALAYKAGDIKSAVEWMNKSANKNNNKAYFFLGALYLKGEGVKKDVQKSYVMFEKSEKLGNPDAKKFKEEVYNLIMREGTAF